MNAPWHNRPPPKRGRYLLYGVIALFLMAFLTTEAEAQTLPPETLGGMTAPNAPGGTSVQAQIGQTGNWSSNPLLATQGAKSLWGSTTSPELTMKDATPESQFMVDTRIDENIFNQTAFNSTDVHAAPSFTTQNERWNIGLQQRTDYDTTRTSELSNFGLSPIIARHLGLSLAPSITYNATPVDSFGLSGSVADSQYDNTAFTDYATYSASPTYTHHIDPRNAFIISAQAQQYQTTRNNQAQIDSAGPSLGWQTVLSPRFSANAALGAQATRQYDFSIPIGPWTWQYTYSAALTFKGTQDLINLSAQRQQFPYGNGTDALQTNFTLSESHALNPLVSLNLGGSYISSSYQFVEPGSLDALFTGTLGLSYHATERLDFNVNYQYRYETLTQETQTANDKAVTVGLVYHPQVWTMLQ